ncbi:L-aminoadipate-semialdehyde dehydrogenase (nonribosomal peptide synthetase) [Phlyctema vagabunda]|uniref:L-aminoadipate-semialdehyde dehydrogenase (Nonribosomal peptide synthetase) n=1 Tax=Phlyctema vagabunda TaxID=108571 RepID=A0ABR4PAA3_9HELO
MFGTTECSSFPTMETHREDWNYLNYHPAAGFEFRENFDGLFEKFQVRNKKYDAYQGIFQTFPDIDEFPTRDLYSKHPTRPNYWLYRGRADHIIVLSNGEKLNPLDMEATINDHPDVKASLIVGSGRFQTLALIELNKPLPSGPEELKAFQESIWETVKIANIEAPAHAQLYKDYIMFASPDKPFPLAGKGTVLRNETLKLYQEEIDNIYQQADREIGADDVDFDGSSLETVALSICNLLPDSLKDQKIGAQDDFFAAGLDSLSVFSLVRNLRAVVNQDDSISASTIYGNPTIEKLSRAVYTISHPDAANDRNLAQETLQEMRQMIDKYTTDLPQREALPRTSDAETSVILTGSTGSLGSYLLEKLVSLPHIKKIFCFNRALDGRAKQTEASGARGLKTDWPSERVQFFKADLSKPDFGLDAETFEEVRKSATHIIHNQWQVDFNLSLSSFEPHIRGVRNLVDFSIQSENNAKIFFISSVAVGMKGGTETIPETPIMNLLAGEGGYGQSKLVSEWILEIAKNQSCVPTAVCRVGQIAGPVDVDAGMWNKQEWLPTIISTSKYLGLIPSSLSSMSSIDWLPVNSLSTILAELASLSSPETSTSSPSEHMPIFHTVNPSTVPWSALLPTITSHLGPTVAVTGWKDWLAALEQSASNGDDVEKNPGIKLLDFYRGLEHATGADAPVYQTANTVRYSRTLEALGPVQPEWFTEWLTQWGFLNMAIYGR